VSPKRIVAPTPKRKLTRVAQHRGAAEDAPPAVLRQLVDRRRAHREALDAVDPVQAAELLVDLEGEAAAILAAPPAGGDLGERFVDDPVELGGGVGDRREPVRVLVRLVSGERRRSSRRGEHGGEGEPAGDVSPQQIRNGR
jgi:hypothetical protein